MILGIHHVQITVPPGGETHARAFYCDVLGLPEVEKPDSLKDRGGLWIRVGDRDVHIGTEDGADRVRSKTHVAYEVHDLSLWREKLLTAGIETQNSVPIEGFDRFESRDPFGNRIEFIQV